jgi:hypothetical protein
MYNAQRVIDASGAVKIAMQTDLAQAQCYLMETSGAVMEENIYSR